MIAAEICDGATIGMALVAVIAALLIAAVLFRNVDPERVADWARHGAVRVLVVVSAFRSRRRHPGAFECPPACAEDHTYRWPCAWSAR